MLTTRRPTQTTIQYTYSTRSPGTTATAQLSKYALVLSRILAGFFVATIMMHDLRHSLLPNRLSLLTAMDDALRSSQLRWPAQILESLTTGTFRLFLCLAAIWIISRKGYTEESLLVIQGLGVQTSTNSPSYLWTGSTRFIPTSSIQDIYIYEAFKGFATVYYLCIVVEGEGDVVVVFPDLLPQRAVLEQVWRGARACLYETTRS